MVYNYSDFLIQEGYSYSEDSIYWNSRLNELLNNDWYDISVTKYKRNFYYLKFRVKEKDEEYNYYSVLVEDKNNNDIYYMEDSSKFVKKFKSEFFRNASEYVDKLVYEPKCLGDLQHVKDGNKFNI